MPPINTQPLGSAGATGSNGSSSNSTSALPPRYRPDPSNTRVLLRSLEDLRDSLSNRVEQLSVAVERLRGQAGELERAASLGTALSPNFGSTSSASSTITPLPRPVFARMSAPRTEQASSPLASTSQAAQGGRSGGHGYATRLAYIPTPPKQEPERSKGRPPTNLAAIAKQPEPIVVRSPRPTAEASPPDAIAYSPLPVEPPSEPSDLPRVRHRYVYRTPSQPPNSEPPSRPIVTRTVSERTRVETVDPQRSERYGAYLSSGLTSRGIMVRERQDHASDPETRNLAQGAQESRTRAAPSVPPSFTRDLGARRRHAYVRTLEHQIENAETRLINTRAEWMRSVRNGADNGPAIMQRHVDVAHHLWDLVTEQAESDEREDLPIDAMQYALSLSLHFRHLVLGSDDPQSAQERLSDAERTFLNRIMNAPADLPLSDEYNYYREFLFEDRRRQGFGGAEEGEESWLAERLELLDLVSRSRAHVQGVTRALSPEWWEEQAREMEEQAREERDDDGEETDEDESPFLTWVQARRQEAGSPLSPARESQQLSQQQLRRQPLLHQHQRHMHLQQVHAMHLQHAALQQRYRTQEAQQMEQRAALERDFEATMQPPLRISRVYRPPPPQQTQERALTPGAAQQESPSAQVLREYWQVLRPREERRSPPVGIARDPATDLRRRASAPSRDNVERRITSSVDGLPATSSTIALIEQSRARAHAMTRELDPGLLSDERTGMRHVLENLERMLDSGRHSEDIRRRLEALATREREVLAEIDSRLEQSERERLLGLDVEHSTVFDRILATEARVEDLGRTSRRLASQRAELGAWANVLPPPSNAATAGSARRLSDATVVPPEDSSRSSSRAAARPSLPTSPLPELRGPVPFLPPALTPRSDPEPSYPNTPEGGQRDDVIVVEAPREIREMRAMREMREIDLADIYNSEEEKDEDDAALSAQDWPAAPAPTQGRRQRPYVSILDL